MPVKQSCNPLCVVDSTWGCDYPATTKIGAIHFDGGGQGRFEVWDGANWVAASFEPGTHVTILRPDPWLDLTYKILANGTSWKDITQSVCGNDAEEIIPTEHRIVLQRCEPAPENCHPSCDCLSGPHEQEGITFDKFMQIVAELVRTMLEDDAI